MKNTNFIQFPAADLLVAQIKLDFWRICAFSKVVERIDCTHMKIQFPGGGNAEMISTYNKKRSFRSMFNQFKLEDQNLEFVQAVQAGPNLEIQNFVARWPGSVHDHRIFENSRLCVQF